MPLRSLSSWTIPALLVDTGSEHIKKEMEISLQAGELVGVLYDVLLKQYKDPSDPETLKSLNKLCVRLVFCLYAEDAGIFGGKSMFHDYLQAHEKEARQALISLFKILDQKPEERDSYLDDDVLAFPYANGGLFADENIIIPRLDENIVDLILRQASEDFDWSEISPTIFGAYLYQMTTNSFIAGTSTYYISFICMALCAAEIVKNKWQ